MATFRKNKNQEWVVQGTPAEVVVGKVQVERKDGSSRFVTVLSVGRPFRSFDGSMKVYGYLTATNEEGTTNAPAPVPAPVEQVESYDPCMSPADCEF